MERAKITRPWFVRLYKKGDEVGILKLMSLGFEREYQRTIQHWFWKYADNPFGHLTAVAESNGQIVGVWGRVLANMKIGNRVVPCAQAADAFVHPNFRRQGVFSSLGACLTKEAEKKGIVISYTFPNAQSGAGLLKSGWFRVSEVLRLVKPINFEKITKAFDEVRILKVLGENRILRAATNFALPSIFDLVNLYSKVSNRIDHIETEGMRIHSIDYFDNCLNDFWEKTSKEYPIAVVRDKKYLTWRYFKCPNVNYSVLLAEKKGQICGYVVLNCRKEGDTNVGHIVDIFASFEEIGVIQFMISEAIRYLRERNVDLIVCWMLNRSRSGIVFYRVLRRFGFIPTVWASFPFLAKINSEVSAQFVGDVGNWFITKGDSDQI